MSISAQVSIVAVQIYSIDYSLKCHVQDVFKGSVYISPVLNKVDMFQVNDPVVCIYIENGYHIFRSGDIKCVNYPENIVEISLEKIDIQDERRIFERYPVSLAVSIRRKFSNKRLHFVAKNLSEYGMCAISKSDLDIDEPVDIDLITGKYMFYFGGKVIWKEKLNNCYVYGFQLTAFDISTKSSMEGYLDKLKDEYRGMYNKAK